MLNPEYVLVFTITPGEVISLLAKHHVFEGMDKEHITFACRGMAYLVHNRKGVEGECFVIRNRNRALDMYEDKTYAKLIPPAKAKLAEHGILNINETNLSIVDVIDFECATKKRTLPFCNDCQGA